MVGEEITQKEIQKAEDYLKKNKLPAGEVVKKTVEELRKKGIPKEAILALMLHKIPAEKINAKEIKEMFGEKTLEIMQTINRMEEIIQKNYGRIPAETLGSIALSISNEFEPIIVKLAETANELEAGMDKEEVKIAEDIYAPMATKLGLNDYAWKLQDYSFKVTNPEGWRKIKNLVNKDRKEREELVETVRKEVEELIKGKLTAEVTGRPKNFRAIFEKLKKVPFQRMHDLYGVRIICNKEKECYEALGYIHSKYEIIPEAFDDYITKPKSDGYKSIHTAVKRGKDIIEVQIRTWEQHLRALGQSYWSYKKIRKDKEFEKELSWERQLIEWQKEMGKTPLGKKISGRKIFAFTPKNEAIALPQGASVIDFAFAVHSDIGKRMEKAKVNGKIVPIETKLNNLDRVEIIVSEKPQMKKTWLTNAVSDKARAKVKAFFGLTNTRTKRIITKISDVKKIKMAECCHPLPGEDVVGVKTTKRKIVMHKKDCPNIQNMSKSKLMEIDFEREKGKTLIRVAVIDRPGILGEMLGEIRHSGATLVNTSFKMKHSGYAEAIFEIEIGSAAKLDRLIEKIENIPSVQSAQRV
ncbi:Region found in RelA / SpoT proteins [uncultured archaeon]|nr:Region found in RelA / SpoT proteins [uncultured archaeon]